MFALSCENILKLKEKVQFSSSVQFSSADISAT